MTCDCGHDRRPDHYQSSDLVIVCLLCDCVSGSRQIMAPAWLGAHEELMAQRAAGRVT